jgi:hypothetical protein
MNESSKSQAPSSKEIPSSKHQREIAAMPFWSLGFGASLELGAWDLELFL